MGNSRGGGISFRGPESLPPCIIEDNVIRENFSSRNSGGINIGHAAIIQRNTIAWNRTVGGDGGGIYLLISKMPVIIRDNVVLGNTSGDHGGGMYLSGGEDIEVYGNLLLGNTSSTLLANDCSGAAIWASRLIGNGSILIHHNTIIFNTAVNIGVSPSAGGVCVAWKTGAIAVTQNLIFGNQGGGVVTFAFGNMLGTASVLRNLISENGGPNIWNSHAELVDVEENLHADPHLCDGVNNTSGRVAGESPALTQPFGVIGAFPEPGCTEP